MNTERPIGTGKEIYRTPEHLHEDMILQQRIAMGKNLLGKMVTCTVQDVSCKTCGSSGVKFVKSGRKI